MMTSGLPDCMTFSSTGSRSCTAVIFEPTSRMYGSSSTASMRSVSVDEVRRDVALVEAHALGELHAPCRRCWLSSTVMTPSLPTLSMASAIMLADLGVGGGDGGDLARSAPWSSTSFASVRHATR
jgi:hypothetical protein